MPNYYYAIYHQVVRKLENISARPASDTDEKLQDFSCVILTRENRDGSIEFEVIKRGEFICGTYKQQTDTITVQVDVYKLQNSHYLLQQAGRLTYQLCNASLYDCPH